MLQRPGVALLVACGLLLGCVQDEPCSECAEPPPWTPPNSDAGDADTSHDVSVDIREDGTNQDAEDTSTDGPEDGPPELPPLPASCPPDMTPVPGACMDIYEASRDDATETSAGTSVVASSRAEVLPWQPVDLPTARSGCEAAGKRLCRLDEWVFGCRGPDWTVYSYGDDYDPLICNGIDTYCDCSGACGEQAACPYPHCYQTCGAAFRVMPTGSFPDCTNTYGLFDINGNVWELADSDDGLDHFRGGAYNCSNSESLHRCDHDGTWGPTARGFRCCKDPEQ